MIKWTRDPQSEDWTTTDGEFLARKINRRPGSRLKWEIRRISPDGSYRLEGWFETLRDAKKYAEDKQNGKR